MDEVALVAPIIATVIGAPTVIALVQVIKMTEIIPTRFMALVSVLIGTILGYIAYNFVADPLLILSGFLSGLSATGLYEAVKRPLVNDDI
jgi:uncharacterized membrane protein YeaQ/YmgE (transglycosylase-associated protein family)